MTSVASDTTSDALLQMLLQSNSANGASGGAAIDADSSLSVGDAQQYLAHLTALNVERLAAEPTRLDAEAVLIKSQMEQLAFENYKSFIETADCVRLVTTNIAEINGNVGNLLASLPTLVQACEQFCASANEAVQARELNRVALKRHAQLLDLLEIPQLLHTCISGGFIDEALELEAFAQKLVQMHGDIPVVAQLADEVRLASALLVRQLHEQLRGAIALPACLRVVGYLKRLGNYTEHELRVSFLRSRDAWLTGVLAALPHDTAYGYLSRLADTARLHMFEIVTQYRAIFSTGAGGGAAAGAVAAADGGDSSERGTTALLHSWLVQRTTFFLNALRRDLPQITDGASLASLLDQCMYFGLSLGRVGADFRPLLVPLFAARIFDVFERAVERATQRFVKRVKREQIPAPVTAVGHPAASTAPPSASAAAAASSASAAATQMPAPHASLVAHTWLALLANGWLTALNELRQCAAWLIAQRCADVLARSCTAAAQALRSVADQRLLEGAEATHFATLCGVFCEHLLPFVADCFGAVYRDAATNRRRRDWINMTEPKKLLAGLFEATSEATTAAGAPPSAATSSLSASSDSVKR